MTEKLTLRRVSAADKDILLEWRNDPRVYEYALNPNPVKAEDHERWFAKVLINPQCFFYMGEIGDERIGTVRYDLLEKKNEAEVSISLSPKFWGKGLAFDLMKQGEMLLKKDSDVRVIHATVLNENTASMKLFEKSEFTADQTKFKKTI